MEISIKIKNQFPRSWDELNRFYSSKYSNSSINSLEKALALPFAFMVGVWMEFLLENGVSLDVQSMDLILIEESLWECLQILENTIGHYS